MDDLILTLHAKQRAYERMFKTKEEPNKEDLKKMEELIFKSIKWNELHNKYVIEGYDLVLVPSEEGSNIIVTVRPISYSGVQSYAKAYKVSNKKKLNRKGSKLC